MRIYFCGSIRGGRQDVPIYQRIVNKLQTYGAVLTEHVCHGDISEKGEDSVPMGDKAIHDRDIEWLVSADVVVAEVTQTSLGVGYELGRAVSMKKKMLCLFRPASGQESQSARGQVTKPEGHVVAYPLPSVLSAMIRGADHGTSDSLVRVQDYAEDEVEKVLDQYFSQM